MNLRYLLAWAYRQWDLETPNLEHALNRLDTMGNPEMSTGAKGYLGMLNPTDAADNWQKVACRLDRDGRYKTPLRCAIANVRNPWLRAFLAALVPNALLQPSHVAERFSVPHAVENVVMVYCLDILYREYRDQPEYRPGWVSQSESQRAAVVAGEQVA